MGAALCMAPGDVKDDLPRGRQDGKFLYHQIYDEGGGPIRKDPREATNGRSRDPREPAVASYPSLTASVPSSAAAANVNQNRNVQAAPSSPGNKNDNRGNKNDNRANMGYSSSMEAAKDGQWDAASFLVRLQQARATGNPALAKKVLVEVAENNYAMRNNWKVPRTTTVSFERCRTTRVNGKGRDPVISFSTMSTADAVIALARNRNRRICALNFANGEHVGGGYKNGATAQEEDLCRRIPALYTTLFNASKAGLYPFGPCTCTSPGQPAKYAEVLYTPGLVVARTSEENGYAMLNKEDQALVSLVTAAAPNVSFAKEIYNLDLMYKTVQSIMVAPLLEEPGINTLIIGAWGCGAFGGKPEDVSELFAKAVKNGLARLYDEIHFAIPEGRNAEVFRQVLRKNGIETTELR